MKLPAFRNRRSAIRGFSLIELMIAIMILGLGMVMAATIFPVSLDMTRGTIQLNLSETAADAAVGTLSLRVPRYMNLYNLPGPDLDANGLPVNAIPKLASPNMTAIDESDCHLSVQEQTVLAVPQVIANWWPDVQTGDYIGRSSLFTEASFWDCQYTVVNSSLATFVIPSQNMRPDLTPVDEQPPKVVTTLAPTRPRISVADRVYPPVDLLFDNSTVPPTFLRAQTLAEISQRRYCWTAIHFRDINDQTNKTFFARIVVLYRGNPNARYMKQKYTGANLNVPEPELTDVTDTLFPQAWLVQLDSVADNGVVQCTAGVARLLPVGSYFILAQANNPGAYTKVLQNNWDPGSGSTTTLQVKPGEFPSGTSVMVWVFPPAIRSAPPGGRGAINIQFEGSSPVVDVVPKKVIAG